MSYPKEVSRYTLTDFIIEEEADFFGTGYYFYKNAGGDAGRPYHRTAYNTILSAAGSATGGMNGTF